MAAEAEDLEMVPMEEANGTDAGLRTGPVDDNPLCHSWAVEGECIRNPHYMWTSCVQACSSLKYVDAEPDCSGWAQAGECEKNPGFMFETCNHSCVVLARKNAHGAPAEMQARRNPHLAADMLGGGGDDADGPTHRASTFVPIFVGVLLLLVVGAAVATFCAPMIAEKSEELEAQFVRWSSRLQRRFPRLAPYVQNASTTKLATAFVCCYYLNETLTVLQTNPIFAALFPFSSDGVWQQHVAWVDASNLFGGAAAVCCLLGIRHLACAVVMLGDTLVDSYLLLWRIGMNFLYGRGLYINELMAKKFSLLGCVALMIASIAQANSQTAFSGMLLESRTTSTRLSLALLFGRLLIAVLFLYVGLSELHRLFFQPFTPYLPGDGHDVVWPKAVELLLALPFILGVKTEAVARMLAASLVLEALYAWSWWRIPGDAYSFAHHRRAIHYREHFVTNVATAGGLLFLQKMGPGKYTVDELMKKAD